MTHSTRPAAQRRSRWSWDRGIGDEDWLAHLRSAAAALQRQAAVAVDGAASEVPARARALQRPGAPPRSSASAAPAGRYHEGGLPAPPAAAVTAGAPPPTPPTATHPPPAETTRAPDVDVAPQPRRPVLAASAARQLQPRGRAPPVTPVLGPVPTTPSRPSLPPLPLSSLSQIPVLAPVSRGAGRPAVVALVMEPEGTQRGRATAGSTGAVGQWRRRFTGSMPHAPHEPAAVARARRLQQLHQQQRSDELLQEQRRQQQQRPRQLQARDRRQPAAPAPLSPERSLPTPRQQRRAPSAPRPSAADAAAAAAVRATAVAALPPALAARVRRLLAPSLPPPPPRRSLPPALLELQSLLLARYAAPHDDIDREGTAPRVPHGVPRPTDGSAGSLGGVGASARDGGEWFAANRSIRRHH
jgi:hypothetical protein